MSLLPSARPIRSVVSGLRRVLRILPAMQLSALIMAQTQSQDSKSPPPVKVQEQPKGDQSKQQRKPEEKRKPKKSDKSENTVNAMGSTQQQAGKQNNAASAQSTGGTGPGTGQAPSQTKSPLTSPPVAANPGPSGPYPSLSDLRQWMELANEMAASAQRRFKCGNDLAALRTSAQAASPRLISNLEAYSAGFSKLRDALLLQQAALEKEAEGQSLGRRLIMQEEAADFRAAARRVAEEIIALGQERDAVAKVLAGPAEEPDWTEIRAICQNLQASAEEDSKKWTGIIAGLSADIWNEEHRFDPGGEKHASSRLRLRQLVGHLAIPPQGESNRQRRTNGGHWSGSGNPS